MLDAKEVFRLVDWECKRLRIEADPQFYAYRAPETIAGVESKQVKAMVNVFVKILNERNA